MGERARRAAFVFASGFVTIAVMALVAMVTRDPFVFPSLGPTAFLIFFAPQMAPASPRNTLCGHAIGIACGYLALVLTGLTDAPPAYATGVDLARTLAEAVSLAATGALMVLADVPHPPAGATTLIVSLGVVTRPGHLAVMQLAVALLTLQAIVLNRLAGVPYPLWGPAKTASL